MALSAVLSRIISSVVCILIIFEDYKFYAQMSSTSKKSRASTSPIEETVLH